MPVTASEVKEFLNMKYPVTKKDIIQQAKKNGASSDMMQTLEELPDKEYSNAEELSEEIQQKHKKVFGVAAN
jgi:hypothetical protein